MCNRGLFGRYPVVELALSEGEVTVQLEQEEGTLRHVGSDRKIY